MQIILKIYNMWMMKLWKPIKVNVLREYKYICVCDATKNYNHSFQNLAWNFLLGFNVQNECNVVKFMTIDANYAVFTCSRLTIDINILRFFLILLLRFNKLNRFFFINNQNISTSLWLLLILQINYIPFQIRKMYEKPSALSV